MKLAYHSVHLDPEPAEPRDWWTDGESVAFVRDVSAVHDTPAHRLPAEYDSCDLLYADLPWRSGYSRYVDRAGAETVSWSTFMTIVGWKLAAWNKAAVIVTGIHARRFLPPAAQELPVRMPVAGRQQAIAYVYGAGFTPEWDGTDELLTYLAARFERVGDFCAGYGWAPRAFARAGRSFVASDINPQCVGYIAEHAAEWRPR